jgi:hypothetical protein
MSVLLVAAALAGCGRKAAPVREVGSDFPRFYPPVTAPTPAATPPPPTAPSSTPPADAPPAE